jgi:predicted kinase
MPNDMNDAAVAARSALRLAGASGSRPLLVLVGGAPGSGKTVVADGLGARAGIVTLQKDAFKEPLMSELGVRSVQESTALSAAAVRTLFAAAGAVLRRGLDVIVESTLNADDVPRIAALQAAHRCVVLQVHVSASIDVLVERWHARIGRRHPGHRDAERLPELRARVESGTWDALPLNAPLLRIDTSAGDAFNAGAWLVELRRTQAAAATR